ncbi:MAG: hypothetical protein ACE364_11465 [Chlorobiota bacterium]
MSIESTLIEINGEELENLYDFLVKYENGNLYGKVTILDGKKKKTHDLVQSILENNIEVIQPSDNIPVLTIQSSPDGVCVKHNGIMIPNLVKLYIHIKAKMSNYFPSISDNVTDGTELFEAYYVTEISENKNNIIHVV